MKTNHQRLYNLQFLNNLPHSYYFTINVLVHLSIMNYLYCNLNDSCAQLVIFNVLRASQCQLVVIYVLWASSQTSQLLSMFYGHHHGARVSCLLSLGQQEHRHSARDCCLLCSMGITEPVHDLLNCHKKLQLQYLTSLTVIYNCILVLDLFNCHIQLQPCTGLV